MHVRRLRVFWVLTVVLLLLLVLVVLQSFDNYRTFRDHRLKLSSPDRVVESWMTPLMVERHFPLSFGQMFSVLGVDSSFQNKRQTFDALCVLHHLDCLAVLERLNELL